MRWNGRFAAANVSLVGSNQQAIGARFVRPSHEHFSFVRRRSPTGQHPAMSLRVILITGANGGLGQAIARAFLQESPANFVWLGVRSRREHADKLARENPDRCFCVVALDVASPNPGSRRSRKSSRATAA
jgi:hypothetical protein